jgi:hypothetical protein
MYQILQPFLKSYPEHSKVTVKTVFSENFETKIF